MTTDSPPSYVPLGPRQKWERIWEMSDDFWGPPRLKDIWEPFNMQWPGRAPGFFEPRNVFISPRKSMILTCRRQRVRRLSDPRLQRKIWEANEGVRSRRARNPNGTLEYEYYGTSTSFVRTKHKQLYGYFEAECKLADCRISSAFWFAGEDPDGKKTEIDVFEYSTSDDFRRPDGLVDNNRSIYHTNLWVHRFNWNNHRGYQVPEHKEMGIDLSKGFHKFALDWTPTYLTWYVDDKPVRRAKNTNWDRPLHLQFDRETFHNWFGLPIPHNLPNNFEILYVRSWKR